MIDPTQRFSTRVENYIRYRLGYPEAVLDLLRNDCRLTPDSIVADVGSGTGILSEIFLRNGNVVYAIEPNREMRQAGKRLLQGFLHFHSIAATAEAMALADHSADFIAAGQAFHWFDRKKARLEFARVLKPGGWVVLIWNDRRIDSTPFLRAYEQLLQRYGTDYRIVNHKEVDDDVIRAFFAPGTLRMWTFDNRQFFDFAGLKGRLLSSSYTPEPSHPNYEPMLVDLHSIFDAYQVGNSVVFEYDTQVYYGQL